MGTADTEVLDAIAGANDRFIRLASDVRRWPAVKEVRQELMLKPYRSPGGVMLDLYVDAELPHGPGLVWSLGAWWHPGWGVEGSVRFVFGEDSEDVCRFPGKRTTDAGTFMTELTRVVDNLVASASTLDLASYEHRFPTPDQG